MEKNYNKFTIKDITDGRGSLIALEGNQNVPFDIKRVYYLYKLNEAEKRGMHAHKKLKQLIICIHGKCKIKVFDGESCEIIELTSPEQILYVNNNVWREMYDFEDECVLAVLASEHYDESDYIRNYDDFLRYIGESKCD